MAASLVQHHCECNCSHHRALMHERPVEFGFPVIGVSHGHSYGGSVEYHSANASKNHVFSTASPLNTSAGVHHEIIEPRAYPFNGHVKHTHASYRRESLSELASGPAPASVQGHDLDHDAYPNGAVGTTVHHHPSKPGATVSKVNNSWALCVPIPVPSGLSNAVLESLTYTVRYASSGAGSATVQTDIILVSNAHGPKLSEGIVSDYSKLGSLYTHVSSEQIKGYGPPMVNEALGLALASVPSFKAAPQGEGAWSHYLDHQKVYPNVKIGGGHGTSHLYLFFHVYEYPGANALRSVSVDASATWNDGEEVRKAKEERLKELKEWRLEREQLVLMKREAEQTIRQLEESVKRANEESQKRLKGEADMEKELMEREQEFLELEKKAKESHILEQQKLKQLENDAEVLYQKRLQEGDQRLKAFERAEAQAKAEHEKRMKEEEENLRKIAEAEERVKQREVEEQARMKEIEAAQRKLKEEVEKNAEAEQRVRQRELEEQARLKQIEEAQRKLKEDAEKQAEAERKAREEAEQAALKLKQEQERLEKAAAAAAHVLPSISEAPRVADEKMQQRIEEVAAKLGQKCKNGYAWEKKTHGYKCSGGGHFISFKDLGMN